MACGGGQDDCSGRNNWLACIDAMHEITARRVVGRERHAEMARFGRCAPITPIVHTANMHPAITSMGHARPAQTDGRAGTPGLAL